MLYKKLFVYMFWLHWTLRIDVQFQPQTYETTNEFIPSKKAEIEKKRQQAMVDQAVLCMLLREKLKRKYLKLFTLLPTPKDHYLDL